MEKRMHASPLATMVVALFILIPALLAGCGGGGGGGGSTGGGGSSSGGGSTTTGTPTPTVTPATPTGVNQDTFAVGPNGRNVVFTYQDVAGVNDTPDRARQNGVDTPVSVSTPTTTATVTIGANATSRQVLVELGNQAGYCSPIPVEQLVRAANNPGASNWSSSITAAEAVVAGINALLVSNTAQILRRSTVNGNDLGSPATAVNSRKGDRFPDGTIAFAIAENPGKVMIVNEDGSVANTFTLTIPDPATQLPTDVACGTDRFWVVLTNSTSVRCYSKADGSFIESLEVGFQPAAIEFSVNGNRLDVASSVVPRVVRQFPLRFAATAARNLQFGASDFTATSAVTDLFLTGSDRLGIVESDRVQLIRLTDGTEEASVSSGGAIFTSSSQLLDGTGIATVDNQGGSELKHHPLNQSNP